MKIIISKSKWDGLGKTAAKTSYITREELNKRLVELGWDWKFTGDKESIFYTAPTGGRNSTVLCSWHQYDQVPATWKNIKSDITKRFPTLEFVWQNPFIIPENFNRATQSIVVPSKQEIQTYTRPIARLPVNTPIEVFDKEEWSEIAEIDYGPNPSILLKNGKLLEYKSLSDAVEYREKQIAASVSVKKIRIISIKLLK